MPLPNIVEYQREPLDIKDYLEASGDASSRTRTALITLVLASIVGFAAVLHTMQGRWMHQRIQAAQEMRSPYVAREIGPYPEKGVMTNAEYADAVRRYEHRYLTLCEALEKTDIDNFIVSVPFIGFTFDVNDLGILGALGFVIILTVYRFFLARELENLRLSFRAARVAGMAELEKFYTLLSMRQVFTVPQSDIDQPWRFRAITHEVLVWLPVLVMSTIEADDWSTFDIGKDIDNLHADLAMAFGTLGLILCVQLSIAITLRIIQMDKVWLACRRKIVEWKAEEHSTSPEPIEN